jgi:hypothetical protein
MRMLRRRGSPIQCNCGSRAIHQRGVVVGDLRIKSVGDRFKCEHFLGSRLLNGRNSHAAKNFSHIAQTFGFLCAALIASCDFRSDTSMIVPSRAHDGWLAIGYKSFFAQKSIASTSLKSSFSFPGLGRYATITIMPFVRWT